MSTLSVYSSLSLPDFLSASSFSLSVSVSAVSPVCLSVCLSVSLTHSLSSFLHPPLPASFSNTHTRTRTHTHARTRTHTRAHTHTHTHIHTRARAHFRFFSFSFGLKIFVAMKMLRKTTFSVCHFSEDGDVRSWFFQKWNWKECSTLGTTYCVSVFVFDGLNRTFRNLVVS